jgi:hypothetical protein
MLPMLLPMGLLLMPPVKAPRPKDWLPKDWPPNDVPPPKVRLPKVPELTFLLTHCPQAGVCSARRPTATKVPTESWIRMVTSPYYHFVSYSGRAELPIPNRAGIVKHFRDL